MSRNKLLPNEKLTFEENNLKRVISWINTSDIKTAAIITFHIFLMGSILGKSQDIRTSINANQTDFHCLIFFLACYATFSIFSIYYAFRTMFPEITPLNGPSLLFFGTIPTYGRAGYKEKFRGASVTELEEEILDQTYINAEIATFKFNCVKKSMQWLLLSMVFWVIFFILYLT